MTSPSHPPLLALDVIPTISSNSVSPTKPLPLILSNIRAHGTGLGIIAADMFEPKRWYLSSCSSHTLPRAPSHRIPSKKEVRKEESNEDRKYAYSIMHIKVPSTTRPQHPVPEIRQPDCVPHPRRREQPRGSQTLRPAAGHGRGGCVLGARGEINTGGR